MFAFFCKPQLVINDINKNIKIQQSFKQITLH